MLILRWNEFWRKEKEGEKEIHRVKHFSTLKWPRCAGGPIGIFHVRAFCLFLPPLATNGPTALAVGFMYYYLLKIMCKNLSILYIILYIIVRLVRQICLMVRRK